MKSWKKRWNNSVYGKAAVILQILLIVVLIMAVIEYLSDYSYNGMLELIFMVLFNKGPLILGLILLILVMRTVDTGVRQHRSIQSFSGDEAMSGLAKSRVKSRLVSFALIAAGIMAAIVAGKAWVFVVFLLIAGLIGAFANANYNKNFGDTVTVRELQKVFSDVTYENEGYQAEAQQKLSTMPFLVSGNEPLLENSLSGALGTTRFRSVDLKVFNRQDSALEDRDEVTVLLGKFRVYTLEYRRPFQADTVVKDRKFKGGTPERTGLTMVIFQSGQPEFDKRFQVWAKNAEEAEKVLSSERIQAMVRIAEYMPERPCCFSMAGNLLHVAQNLPKYDVLAPDTGSMSETLEEQMEIAAKEVAGMKEIVSWLSLFGEQG